ncbi:hypothetical protein JCM9279_006271 [Rhodotorula babjevae]
MSSLNVPPPALAGLAAYSPELDSFLRREMESACDSLSQERVSPVVDIISREFAEHKQSPGQPETNYVNAASNKVAQTFRHFLIACDNVQVAVADKAARRSDHVAVDACNQVKLYMDKLYMALLNHLARTTAQHPALRGPAPARHSASNSLGYMPGLEEGRDERALSKSAGREGRYRRELIYAGRRY